MAHVEHLVGFAVVGPAFLYDGFEEGRNWEHVVLYDATVLTHEVQHLCLCSACAVYHSVNLRTQFVEQFLHYRSIGASGREDEFACVDRRTLNRVCQFVRTTVHEFFRHSLVIALGISLGQIFAEDIVSGAGKSVRTHSAVVLLLVGGLAKACETHDDVARTDVLVVNHIAALHAAGNRRVHDDSTNEIAHVSSLSASGIDADTHVAHLLQQFVSTVDDGRNHLARDEHLVAANGAADQDVVRSTHAQQVVGIHDQGILCNTFPHREVARLLPVHISQARLRASPVGMHDVAPFGVAAQYVGDNLAESLREEAFVDVLDGVMHVLLSCRHAPQHVTLIFHSSYALFY